MYIGIENIPVAKFDSRSILKQCLKTGKQHRGHKTRNQEDLTELATWEEDFYSFDIIE